MSKILILNGSLGGEKGNTFELIRYISEKILYFGHEVNVLNLNTVSFSSSKYAIEKSDAIFVLTGTYMDSHGSPLQKFLEDGVEEIYGDLFLNKPFSVIVTCHSIGGKVVLNNLIGTLNMCGALFPPCSSVVFSMSNDMSFELDRDWRHSEIFRVTDLDVAINNILCYTTGNGTVRRWYDNDSSFPAETKWLDLTRSIHNQQY